MPKDQFYLIFQVVVEEEFPCVKYVTGQHFDCSFGNGTRDFNHRVPD